MSENSNMPGWEIRTIDSLRADIDRLTAELDGEREERRKVERALSAKDKAMSVLFGRLNAAGVDYSDLLS